MFGFHLNGSYVSVIALSSNVWILFEPLTYFFALISWSGRDWQLHTDLYDTLHIFLSHARVSDLPGDKTCLIDAETGLYVSS